MTRRSTRFSVALIALLLASLHAGRPAIAGGGEGGNTKDSYLSTRLDFQLLYPRDWVVVAADDSVHFAPPVDGAATATSLDVLAHDGPGVTTSGQLLSFAREHWPFLQWKPGTVGGVGGLEASVNSLEGKLLLIGDGGRVIEYAYRANDVSDLGEIHQILDSVTVLVEHSLTFGLDGSRAEIVFSAGGTAELFELLPNQPPSGGAPFISARSAKIGDGADVTCFRFLQGGSLTSCTLELTAGSSVTLSPSGDQADAVFSAAESRTFLGSLPTSPATVEVSSGDGVFRMSFTKAGGAIRYRPR